jgi:hypothetical protein
LSAIDRFFHEVGVVLDYPRDEIFGTLPARLRDYPQF